MHKNRFLAILLLTILCFAVQSNWTERRAAASQTTDAVKGNDFVIVTVKSEESLASLARQYLGSVDKAWQIADYNGVIEAKAGQRLVIPIKPVIPGGLKQTGYQMVPVLYYPKITARRKAKNTVTADLFTRQLRYLINDGFKTVSLDQLYGFLNLKEQLPPKAVVITFDTTRRWAYDVAYPILLRLGLKAAFFIRPDRVGRTGYMTWEEVSKLAAAGFDIGTTGQTGKHLTRAAPANDPEARIDAIEAEIKTPRKVIREKTKRPCHYYAYPGGANDDMVIALLKRYGYRAAFTRTPGGNPFFVDNFKIRRTCIRFASDLTKFKEQLKTFNATDLR